MVTPRLQTCFIGASAVILCCSATVQSAKADRTTFVLGKGYHRTINLFIDAAHPWKSSATKAVATGEGPNTAGHVSNAVEMTVSANRAMDAGKYKDAEQIYWDVLKLRNEKPPQDNPDLAATYHNLGAALECEKNAAMAENVYQRAVRIWEQGGKAEQKELAAELQNLGEFYYSSGDYRKSIESLKRSLQLTEGINGPKSAALASILDDLIDSLEQAGKGKEAAVYARLAKEIHGKCRRATN